MWRDYVDCKTRAVERFHRCTMKSAKKSLTRECNKLLRRNPGKWYGPITQLYSNKQDSTIGVPTEHVMQGMRLAVYYLCLVSLGYNGILQIYFLILGVS